MKNRRFFPLVLALLAAFSLTWTAPVRAGTWSGSTPDNGRGQSVSANGSSTEVEGPPCTITYNSTTTITVTDNATGRVVSTTTRTRMRKYKIKNCPAKVKVVPRPKFNDVLIVPVVPGSGEKADIQITGSSTGSTTVTNNPDGSKTTTKTDESSGPGGYKRTDSTTNTDNKGSVTGGTSRTIERTGTGKNFKRTVTDQHWQGGGWVDDTQPSVVSQVARTATVSLPDSASQGGYTQGTLLVNFTAPDGSTDQGAASGNVTITEPNGKHFRMLNIAEFFLIGDDLRHGRLQIISDPMPGHGGFQIVDSPPASQPNVVSEWMHPPVVTNGSSLTINGSGLATGDGPTLLACTRDGCQPTWITAASDKQLKFDVPKLPPGPCDLVVENGNGRFSRAGTINPVDVSLELPKNGTVGQTLDAVVRLTGLMPENSNRTLQATVNLLGPGTFAGGGMSQVISIVNGVGHVKIVAQSAGTIDVNVRNVH